MREKAVDPQYLSSFPYYGRHGQDKYLNEAVFHGMRNGVFVDLGAYDGVESSNTLFFEESLDWDGVCVEPLPAAFDRLQMNRKCLCINGCASDSYRRAHFTHVIPGERRRLPREGRVPNFEKLSGLTEFLNPKHEQVIDSIIQESAGRREFLTVQCIPVNDILARLPSPRIDYLSIDTEGSEFHILRAIDFERFDIDVIVVEVLYPDDDFMLFMKEHAYDRINIVGYDWIYRKVKP